MQIVIDIPETMVQDLKDGCFGVKHNIYELAGAVCDGVVLPKGHGDLKDMGNLQYVFDLTREDLIYSGKDIERAIRSMKTIIEADSESEEEV